MSSETKRIAQILKLSYITAVLSLATALTVTQASAPISFAAERAVAQTSDVRPDVAPDAVNLLVGFRPGAAYDLYARLSARYMLRYLPRNRAFVVENKPENATETAKRIFRAEPDGKTLAALIPALYLAQLAAKGDPGFDLARMSWIGSPTKSHYLLYMSTKAPFKTMRDIRDASTPPLCGAGTETTTGYYVPKLFEETLGTKFNLRMGFEEGPDTDAAVERGEVQCRALTIDGFFSHEPYPSWIRNNIVRIVLQTGAKRDARLPNVPTLYEVMEEFKTSPENRSLIKLVLASSDFGRPIVGPPGMTANRVKEFRDAYGRALKDPGLLLEAKRSPLEINPTTGQELEKLAKEVVSQPKDLVGRMNKLMGK
jgi:tripartite-type tricarboxylate transporter receptor subunit TctC